MRWTAGLVVLLAALAPGWVWAVQTDALDLAREWRLRALRFRGNSAIRSRELRQALVTQSRSLFAPWRHLPPFDPIAFRTDLERLRQLYRSRGYYEARVEHDVELPAHGDDVVAVVYLTEGPAVVVEHVDVTLLGEALAPEAETELRSHLPLRAGAVFTEDAYTRAQTYLRAYYREHGYARVTLTKRARVDVERQAAEVGYTVESGPQCVFGAVRITGTRRLDPAVLRRELAFRAGEPFRESRVEQTRTNLLALNLFRAIRIDEDASRDSGVELDIHVTEAPPRDVRLGIGYDTEEQIRGIAGWRHYDFLGGARQLGFTGRVSFIRRTLAADFLQPHFPLTTSRFRLLLSDEQQEEDTYDLDQSRLGPRLEWQPTPRLTTSLFYRLDYDVLSNVKKRVRRALPNGAPHSSFVSGFGLGTEWNATDDVLDPSRGWVTSATVEPVGGILGGDVSFVRLVGEGRFYQPLVLGLLGAARLRLGTADPTGSTAEIPLFERFYAGGINSVRGYGRRRIGKLVADEPIGGRSLVDGSVELRHPITEKLGAAVFTDGGQLSLDSFDFPFDRLRYGAGFGVRYKSPVGPLRVDLGFPFQPPRGDAHWQVHVSVGAAF